MFNPLVRKILGFVNGTAESYDDTSSSEGRVDNLGALWTRDYQGQPAQSWTPLTLNDAADQTVPYRAIRFDGGGTVKVDLIDSSGTRHSGITRNVAAGERWDAGLAAVPRIWSNGTTATGIDGLG